MTLSTLGGVASVIASGNGNDWPASNVSYTADSENRLLTVGNGFAYWTRHTGPVLSMPLSGADTPSHETSVVDVGGPSAITFSGDSLFFTPTDYKLQGRGAVRSVVPGEATKNLAENQNIEKYSALAVDEAWVYWGVNDAIKRAPRAGGDAVTVVAALSNPRSLVVDKTSIYWTEDSGGIWRAAKSPK